MASSASFVLQQRDWSSSSSVQATLLQTLNDLQIRSQVEDCVRELVTDVEVASQLQEGLETKLRTDRLKRQVDGYEETLQEMAAVEKERWHRQLSLADVLIEELWSLSRELGDYQEIKEKHQRLLVTHDEVVAKLARAEDDLEAAKDGGSSAAVATSATAAETTSTETTTTTAANSAAPISSRDSAEESTPLPAEAAAQLEETAKPPPTDSHQASEETPGAVPAETAGSTAGSTEADGLAVENAGEAAVALDDGASEDRGPPGLDELDAAILMRMFGFLDALDILNTAQINISMYSRVDSLFGLGNPPDNMMNDASTIATEETLPSASQQAPDAAVQSAQQQPQQKPQPAPVHQQQQPQSAPVQQQPKPAPTSAATPLRAPDGTVSVPAQKVPPATIPVSEKAVTAATSTAVPPQETGGGRGLFSLLQPRRSNSSIGSPGGASSASSPGRKRPGAGAAEAQPMNAAMANSMASKLSDAELNAIILMTERLKHKEQLADKLVKVNEELEAKLEGTEAVKQFLIGKVRDMELLMVKSEDNEMKVAQQIASDQEVIAFLDGRVQELERETRKLGQNMTAAESELRTVKAQSDKRSSVMGDMLQFEREKLADSEREWKATKKLLIKEIKSCRAHILSLQAERDGFREQNEILRNAVLASPSHAQLQQQLNSANGSVNGPWRGRMGSL